MTQRAAVSVALLSALIGAGTCAAHAADRYMADPAGSHLDFVGVQAGAEFKGTFHKFSAAIEFAPDSLPTAKFDVQIDLNSVDTKDNDRDKTLRGTDIFDVAHFPTAHYVTKSFVKTATGFTALGALTLHGVTKEVPIDFKFVAAPATMLEGTANLKRLEFGVGGGDWKSTEWIADAVKITFSLALKPTT